MYDVQGSWPPPANPTENAVVSAVDTPNCEAKCLSINEEVAPGSTKN